MSTDDRTTIDSPCLCGKGTISVEQTSPDHPWVRASQISYDASLNCVECSKTYQIWHRYHGQQPSLVRIADVQSNVAAEAAARAADRNLNADSRFEPLRPKMIALIDAEKTMAAKHRVLTKMGLSRGSYESYRKSPFDGKKAVERATAYNFALAGYMFDLLPAKDVTEIQGELEKIKQLRNQIHEPKAVKTGATWLTD